MFHTIRMWCSARGHLGVVLALAVVLLVAACSSSSDSSNSGNSLANQSFTGSLAGSSTSNSGTVELNVGSATMSAAPMAAMGGGMGLTGTITPIGGTPVSVSGTYDPATHTFTVTGGGWSLTGTFSNGVIEGTYTAPDGTTGIFVAVLGRRAGVTIYCGQYFDASNNALGLWFVMRPGSSNLARGAFASSDGTQQGRLRGTVSGDTVDLNIYNPTNTQIGTATGTISGTEVSGTWTIGSDTGTWSGTENGCR